MEIIFEQVQLPARSQSYAGCRSMLQIQERIYSVFAMDFRYLTEIGLVTWNS